MLLFSIKNIITYRTHDTAHNKSLTLEAKKETRNSFAAQ